MPVERLRDQHVRAALVAAVTEQFRNEADTLILHELGLLSGTSRIDLAVVNGHLHGYEIKSELDTLSRLPRQASIYSAVFDYVTIVASGKHLEAACCIVPQWWGVLQARAANPVDLDVIRDPLLNPSPDHLQILRLLWRSEILEILEEAGCDGGVRSKDRNALCLRVIESLPLPDIQSLVRKRLKARGDWRSAPTPFRNGDSCQSSAKSRHSRANRRWLLSLQFPHPQN
jgi:hypothetical protein